MTDKCKSLKDLACLLYTSQHCLVLTRKIKRLCQSWPRMSCRCTVLWRRTRVGEAYLRSGHMNLQHFFFFFKHQPHHMGICFSVTSLKVTVHYYSVGEVCLRDIKNMPRVECEAQVTVVTVRNEKQFGRIWLAESYYRGRKFHQPQHGLNTFGVNDPICLWRLDGKLMDHLLAEWFLSIASFVFWHVYDIRRHRLFSRVKGQDANSVLTDKGST